MTDLTDMQRTLLALVNEICSSTSGFTTNEIKRRVDRQPCSVTNAQHAALVLRELKVLEAHGLIRRLDDQLPIVWATA